jgi:hypothetical protein
MEGRTRSFLDAYRSLIWIGDVLVAFCGSFLTVLSAIEHSAEMEHSRHQVETGLWRDCKDASPEW